QICKCHYNQCQWCKHKCIQQIPHLCLSLSLSLLLSLSVCLCVCVFVCVCIFTGMIMYEGERERLHSRVCQTQVLHTPPPPPPTLPQRPTLASPFPPVLNTPSPHPRATAVARSASM